jgi:hypothetical protein
VSSYPAGRLTYITNKQTNELQTAPGATLFVCSRCLFDRVSELFVLRTQAGYPQKSLAACPQYLSPNSIVISAEPFSFLKNICVLEIPRNGKSPCPLYAQ